MKKALLATGFLLVGACSDSLPTGTNSDMSPSYAAAKGESSGNKLQCFDGTTDGGYTGTCTLITNGATLNTIDNDIDPYNNYAGVYIPSNLGGRLLGDVNKLSFDYDGSGAAGGSPRISLPIDEDNDGDTEGYAYIDTQGCNTGDANVGTLDAINDPTCTVWYNNVSYENWGAFVTANPNYRVAKNAVTFIIVDAPGTFNITNVQLGKGTAKGK
ncbi:MAG TPA: hypothetical protein VJL35_15910 [Gemmatimonadaceae bacterium]|nr:hypothetical protein [Gemmatimonadaceae bacterium]